MDLSGVPQPKMDWESTNLPDAWKKFQHHVDLVFKGPLKDKEEEVKCNYLLLWVGSKGRDIFNTWTVTDAQAKQLKTYYEKFKAYVQPKLNPVFARYKFNNEVQGSKTFEQFVTSLKLLVIDCSFRDDTKDEMIRDRIVFGVREPKVREKLINLGSKLTLEKAIETGQSFEYSQEQLRSMTSGDVSSDVHLVQRRGQKQTHRTKGHQPSGQPQLGATSSRAPHRPGKQSSTAKCSHCGYKHSKTELCRAKGKRCDYCHKMNHFASVCRAKKSVSEVNSQEPWCENECESDFYVDSVDSVNEIRNNQAFVELEVGQKHFQTSFKVDTGSQVNILPSSTFYKLGIKTALQKPSTTLTAYDGKTLNTLGFITLPCKRDRRSLDVAFYVVETKSQPILRLKTCIDFDIVKLVLSCDTHVSDKDKDGLKSLDPDRPGLTKQSVLKQFTKVFDGVGLFPGECSIHVDPNATPVIHPPRKVPIALRDKVQQELDRMVQQGIICKVTEPTKWVNSMVIVEKPSSGKLRICLDPCDLNKAILRPHYPMKTLEDVLPQLSGAKYFTKLDARSGYWAIKLSEESSFLTTFNSPNGRYRYLRCPFGLKSSQDEFQRKMDECLEGLHGVCAIVDDILVHGQTRQEHDRNLETVLKRCLDQGIRFNEEKLEVAVTEVQYFGHTLTSDGLKPDPAKVKAITDMEPPQNRAELETLLGTVNYMAKFCPNLAQVTSPLRQLLSKGSEFRWDSIQANAFNEIKTLMTQAPLLSYFDPDKTLTIQCDASKYGLGSVALQNGKPIAYASKSLTPTEINYSQIEKEMFAILFGCKRFHQYVYGREVLVETDHLPIISIMKKPLHQAPPRLQRMLFQLQQYNIQVKHLPGKQIPVADTLSRKFLPDTDPTLSQSLECHVNVVMSSLPVSDQKLQEIRNASENDTQLCRLRQTILDGWPESRKKCPPEVTDYWNHRDELSVINGLILKNQKIVIPKILRPKMLEILHQGHFGCERTLRRARDTMFWPNISGDIKEMVLSCPICLEHRKSNPKEPLISHEIPEYPWQNVATDLFTWDDKDFLLTVDYYSSYFEVQQLTNTKSKTVVNKLKSVFARHGIPAKVVSDNGPQFASAEFADFARDWDFRHETSSPHYAQSNGLAEKMVGVVKHIFSKAKSAGTDPYKGILEYRTTCLKTGYSPAQLLMGRNLRSVLPTVQNQLLPKTPSTKHVRKKISKAKQEQKYYYDRSSKHLTPLKVGDSARIQRQDGRWKPGVISEKHNDRSFTFRTLEGAEYRRNRRHLLKTEEKFPNYHSSPDLDILSSDKTPEEPSQIPQSPQVEKPPSVTRDTSQLPQPYVTRSGRQVKPKIIQSM